MRRDKRYSLRGRAGLVDSQTMDATGSVVSIYHAFQANLDDDYLRPWAVVCETHGTTLRAETLQLARSHMVHLGWCEECQNAL